MIKSYISLFLLFSMSLLSAQSYKVTRYADNNGLSSRIVRDVIQDHHGYIWVGGNNGLFRFDGQYFKPYLASLKDTIGLRDNKITSLIEATDNRIWVGTPKGLHVFEKGQLKHVPLKDSSTENEEYVLDIFEDDSNHLWIATYGGVFLLKPDGEALHFLEEDNVDASVARKTVWATTQDRSGRIWIATNDGFYVKEASNLFSFDKMNLLLKDDLLGKDIGYYRIQEYKDSLLIIDSSEGVLKGKIKDDFLSLERFLDAEGEHLPTFSTDYSLIDTNGDLWVALWKKGLKKYKIDKDRLVEEQLVSSNGFLGMSDVSHSIFEDNQENIWVANTNGLYMLSIDKSSISVFPPKECLEDFYGIYGIIEDGGENLWITTPTTLYRIKKKDLLNGHCPEDYLTFADDNMQQARDLFIDSKNRLWVGADGGLFVAQLDDAYIPKEFIRYTISDGLRHNSTFQVYEIEPDKYWVGTYGGLVRMELENGILRKPKMQVFESNKKQPESLVNSYTNTIAQDYKGNYWLGTFSGVSHTTGEGKSIKFNNYTSTYGDNESLSNNSIKKIFKDSRHNLWIATQRGLNRYLPETDKFVRFGHQEGLPSEYILGIQEDSKGYYWICTTNGVLKTKYDSITQQFVDKTHFTSQNGLADNIPYRNAIHIDENDNVFIGSRDGITVFKENISFKNGSTDFKIVLTAFDRIGKRGKEFNSVLSRVEEEEKLQLNHSENAIRIRYASLDFSNPKSNRYRYKFLSSNDSWIETGNNPELTFYNLAPGDYDLLLDGSNSFGQWSGKPIHLKFSIAPPIWKSNWAYTIYSLLFLGLLRYIYVVRVRKKEKEFKRRAQLETAIIKEREQLRQENAADFHDELGSLVTKISLFLTMAERSWKEKDDPTPFFNKIRANVKGLSTGFRDLLWVIDPQKDSLADTFLRLKEFGEDAFDKNSLNFVTSKIKEDYYTLSLDPQTKKQVVMIFKEAITNCLKYCDGSNVEMHLNSNGKFSKMTLSDNGSGFDIKKKSKGRGLKNMKARAEKIGAELLIKSSVKGTVIELDRIPHIGDTFSLQDD